MIDQRKKFGDLGEEMASSYLKKKGYKILERHFQTRFGEVDIIARFKNSLILVEVKTRKTDDFGAPEEAVNERKLEKIMRTGYFYQNTHQNVSKDLRIDVIAITFNKEMKLEELKHLENVWL